MFEHVHVENQRAGYHYVHLAWSPEHHDDHLSTGKIHIARKLSVPTTRIDARGPRTGFVGVVRYLASGSLPSRDCWRAT